MIETAPTFKAHKTGSMLCLFSKSADFWKQRDEFIKCGFDGGFRHTRHTQEAAQYLAGVGDYRLRRKYPFPSALLVDLSDHVEERLALIADCVRLYPDLEVVSVLQKNQTRKLMHDVRVAGAHSFIFKP